MGMRTFGLASIGMLLATAAANATTIDITNVQVPYGLYGVVLTGGDLPGASPYSVYLTGEIVLTTQEGDLATWCVDLFHDINLGGSYTYTTMPLTTDNSGSMPSNSNPLTTQQIDDMSGKADADSHVRTGIFEDQIPADDPGNQLAHGGVGIGVGRAGNRNHGSEFCITKTSQSADEGDEEKRDGGRPHVREEQRQAGDVERSQSPRPPPLQPPHLGPRGDVRIGLEGLGGAVG